MTSHWEAYHSRWSRLRPPLRPAPAVVAAISEELAAFPAAHEPERACLLLGVTPELAKLHSPLVAVDRNQAMIDALWVGNDAERRAVRADWAELDSRVGPLGCAVGDGSLNVMAYPHPQIQVLKRLRALIPGHGGIVLRCFVRTPTERGVVEANAETPEQVCATPEGSASFHGFKWRLAMALCNERGSTLQVAALWGKFHRTFRDRAALAERTGWSLEDIQTIDVYADSREIYSFPSRNDFVEVAANGGWSARFREVDGYELAERCPLLILT